MKQEVEPRVLSPKVFRNEHDITGVVDARESLGGCQFE